MGLELRVKVSEYVIQRIAALRELNANNPPLVSPLSTSPSPFHPYENIACMRCNAMKYLPNFFRRGQLRKLFFLFPDPHFKKCNHKRRIISPGLNAEYAYVLRPGVRSFSFSC